MEKVKQFVKGFKEGFKNFSGIITNIVNFFLLAIVYFLGIGPVSIISKIRRKHFIELGRKRKDSYWIQRKTAEQKIEDYYRMF